MFMDMSSEIISDAHNAECIAGENWGVQMQQYEVRNSALLSVALRQKAQYCKSTICKKIQLDNGIDGAIK